MTKAFGICDTQERSQSGSRVRASASAIKAALTALRETGIAVDKVCVSGGKVEIHCAHIEGERVDEKDGGLEEW